MTVQMPLTIASAHEKYVAGGTLAWRRRRTTILAARNEYVNAQVFLSIPERLIAVLGGEAHLEWSATAPRVRIEATDLVRVDGKKGASLPAPTLRFQGLAPDDTGRLIADPLILDEACVFEHRDVCPIWVRAYVPKDAKPGAYESTISLHVQKRFDDEEKIGEVTLAIQVAAVALPDAKDFSFNLDLWQHPASIARHHHVPLWSADHFRLIEAYLRPLGEIGQKSITVIASDVPWSGQNGQVELAYPSSVYEHSMVHVRKSPSGRLRCDFRALDRYLRAAERSGVGPEIEVIGLLGVWNEAFGHPIAEHADNVRVRYYDETAGAYRYMRDLDDFGTYVRLFAAHLARKGLLDRTFICSDEPADQNVFGKALSFLQGIELRFNFRVAANHREFMETFFDVVKDWVPYLGAAVAPDILKARIAERVKKAGGRFWWYVCCCPDYPNTFIRSPLVESRVIPWLTRWLDYDGFLRWAYCCFPADPWRKPGWRFTAGDMGIVYPGAHGGPVLTNRYEILRAGIQDYELMRLTEEAGRGDNVTKALRRMIKARQPGAFNPDRKAPAEKLYTLREADVTAARKLLLGL